MKKLVRIVENNNEEYDSWIMLNIYPQRAINPDNLDRQRNEDIHKKNLHIIERYVNDNSSILCSWGASIGRRAYLIDCLNDIYKLLNKKQNIRYFRISELLKDGHPRHILYANIDNGLIDFDMDDYIITLRTRQAE
jgi:hypothetical protein